MLILLASICSCGETVFTAGGSGISHSELLVWGRPNRRSDSEKNGVLKIKVTTLPASFYQQVKSHVKTGPAFLRLGNALFYLHRSTGAPDGELKYLTKVVTGYHWFHVYRKWDPKRLMVVGGRVADIGRPQEVRKPALT